MSRFLRISDAASLALHAMALLAGRESGRFSARGIAQHLCASEAHLSKVLQRLAKAGLVSSVRGRHGGFALTRPAAEVNLLEVYEAIDGPAGESACLFGTPVCAGETCILGDLVEGVNLRVKEGLACTRLSDAAGHLVARRPKPGRGRRSLSGGDDGPRSRGRGRSRREEGEARARQR